MKDGYSLRKLNYNGQVNPGCWRIYREDKFAYNEHNFSKINVVWQQMI